MRRPILPPRLAPLLALTVLIPVALAGCATSSTPGGPSTASTGGDPAHSTLPAGQSVELQAQVARMQPGDPADAGAAMTAVGVDLLGATEPTANAVVGPTSVFTVLAMAAAGAKGSTAEQLANYLGADADQQQSAVTTVEDAVAAAVTAGTGRAQNDDRPFTVEFANSLWQAPSLAVRPEYLDALAGGFGAGMYQVDYAADPEAAREAINGWVDERTASLIPELIKQGVITTDTVLTLVNATYLSAPWQTEFFTPGMSSRFETSDGRTVSLPLMRASGYYSHSAGPGWTAVTIPYRGGDLAMTVVLPDDGSFDAVRSDLASVLPSAVGGPSSDQVNLSMPAFDIDTPVTLTDHLKARGVTDLWTSDADLSGIAGQPGDLVATDLVHQAVISVDEEGTEAAAATAMVMSAGAAAPQEQVEFAVNRSFFFAVHDTGTGAPLFLGQVVDPTA